MPGAIRYTLESKDLPKEIERLHGAPARLQAELGTGMVDVLQNVRGHVLPRVPVWRGVLRRSLGSKVISAPTQVTGIFGSNLVREVYPAVMEGGRQAGAKAPPPGALDRWVERVLGVPAKDVRRVAFLVGRKIAARGIKGREFMRQGLVESENYIVQRLNRAVENTIRFLAGKG